MRIHYQWHCPFCDKVLESRKQFQKHKKEYHYKLKVKNTYIKICYCQYCNETFDTRQKLYEHLKICEEKIKLKINEKLEKHKVYVNRYELNGILKDELDRYNYKKFPEKIWIERKEKILNCGVDLMKFGVGRKSYQKYWLY